MSVWLTDLTSKSYLAEQSPVTWKTGSAASGSTITVDTTRAYQKMEGFGASFTDSSAWLVGTKLDAAQRNTLMRVLFSRSAGIGLSFIRQPMAASDFTRAATTPTTTCRPARWTRLWRTSPSTRTRRTRCRC